MLRFPFGRLKDGRAVSGFLMENACGAMTTILDYGCVVQSLSLPGADGRLVDVVLGYETVGEYEENDGYMGAVVGRFANRIGGGALTLGGKTYRLAKNDGSNHLHGGPTGFDRRLFEAEPDGDALVLRRLSPDGEEGYPGNLSVTVTYKLTDDNALSVVFDAVSDADTVVNLASHGYFNLNARGTVLRHELQVFADTYTENDASCLPTGSFVATAGTPFDFRKAKQLGRDIDVPCDIQLKYGCGYDHNFVLSDTAAMKKAAVLYSPDTGIRMTVHSTQPGLQVYSGNQLTPRRSKNGTIDRRCGLCLETQGFPNAAAFPHFPSPILRAGARYHAETFYRFDV